MYTLSHDTDTGLTRSGARKRADHSIVGQLNLEWSELRTSPLAARTVHRWAGTRSTLAGCANVGDIEGRVAAADRQGADAILLTLLELAAEGEQLAGRTVLQLMLGKAVRIAASHTGRADRDTLEQLAVAALWDVIATYPIARRRQKVAANLAMDTLRHVVTELAPDRHETPTEPDVVSGHHADDETPDHDRPVDLELLEVLAWGVDREVLTRDEATILVRVYSPGPGQEGGAAAAAELGLTWPAARQRCSRAIRKLTTAIREDSALVA